MRSPDFVSEIQIALRKHERPDKAEFASNWFKNRPGYAPDDFFIGVTVPEQRKIARDFYKLISIHDTEKLLTSKWHEERLTGLFILVLKYQKQPLNRQAIFDLYITNLRHVNNWDLVDSSAPYIVGEHLKDDPYKLKVLLQMARAKGAWERRVAMLAAGQQLRHGQAEDVLVLAKALLQDTDDYIHKAVGWMLREMGAKVDQQLLLKFLDQHAGVMPRTALRYAIEHLSKETRQQYMRKKYA